MTEQETRARLHDALRRAGYRVPREYETTPPLVVWQHAGCRKRVLRLFLTPSGWALLTEKSSETLDNWLARIGMSREAYDETFAPSAGEVRGQSRVLPLNTSEWPQAKFEVGCERHLIGYVDLDLLREDADEVRATRVPKRRSVAATP